MAPSRRAIVVGAGIGGLAAGVALQRAGWEVEIHERAASPRELGFGLLLAPNALAALKELGVADAVVRSAAPATSVEIRRLDGRRVRRFRSPLGGPSVVALRSELHGALLAAVGENCIHLNSLAEAFDLDSNGVTLRVAGGATHRADVLVAADGVGSAIRRQLHPSEPHAESSGYCAVRGVAFGVSAVLGDLAGIGYLDDGIEIGTARGTSDAVYWYMSLIADEFDAARRTPAAVLARVVPGCDPLLATLLTTTKPEDMRFDELFRRDPLVSWGSGRVTLLGDAAHPVMPHTGQGAAQALEDGVALGLVLRGETGIEASLRRYEQVRSQRTRAFVRLGPRIARMTTTRSRVILALRDTALKLMPEALLQRSAAGLQRYPHAALRS
ncbi:MAG TPA: FAD-dependent monooxygenase [Vicinamibacterales bacterium]|nr:FAD-dependent monooxygenase [Vicinamibacterales bacterium]